MGDPLLYTRGLTKWFGAVKACSDLDLAIYPGEIHGLIGPNGAGKTTLLNQLSGDLKPDGGRIFFDGREITRQPRHRRAHLGLGRSYQITALFQQLTVEENFLLAIQAHQGHSFRFWRKAASDPRLHRRIAPAMAQVDLAERARTPAGRLSHGEQRQLEVGMALAGNPKLLLLDEPMAGMGPGGAVELSKLILKLKERVSILLVEHDMEAIFALADRITVLVYGEVLASGRPEEIRADSRVRRAYLGDEA